ncbi:MAG: hypothetical protein K8I82_01280 [Anaerolineae bacterium]|nr:hypothetical protein [Anaerolineae bacterium]
MGIAFVTSADSGKFDDGRFWGNCYYFEDYRDDDGNHIGYKPGKSPVTPEVVAHLLENGVGVYELFHKPRPNSSGKAVSTIVRADFLKPLDLFGQVDMSKIDEKDDALYVISFDRGQLQDKTLWRNAYGLQPYREDSENSMGYKPMKFDVLKSLEETFLKDGVGFYACGYDTKPVTNPKTGNVESVLILSKAASVKSFDVFGWYDFSKAKPLAAVSGGKTGAVKPVEQAAA